MGMIPHAELENVAYAVNGVWVNSSNGTFSADQIVTVTPTQVLNTDGARVPSSSTSQKSFNVLNVIVTTASVSTGEIGNMDEEAYRFGLAGDEGTSSYNFWEATGGRGTLNMATALSALKPELTPAEDDEAICFPIKVEGSGTATICL